MFVSYVGGDGGRAAHEWGENGHRRPVSKVANKLGQFSFLYIGNNEHRFFSSLKQKKSIKFAKICQNNLTVSVYFT